MDGPLSGVRRHHFHQTYLTLAFRSEVGLRRIFACLFD